MFYFLKLSTWSSLSVVAGVGLARFSATHIKTQLLKNETSWVAPEPPKELTQSHPRAAHQDTFEDKEIFYLT